MNSQERIFLNCLGQSVLKFLSSINSDSGHRDPREMLGSSR